MLTQHEIEETAQRALRMLEDAEVTPPEVWGSASHLTPEGMDVSLQAKLSQPIIAQEHESLAFAPITPKTAALSFDRVYRPPLIREDIPPSIAFYGATDAEQRLWAAGSFFLAVVRMKMGLERITGQPHTWSHDLGPQERLERARIEKRTLLNRALSELGPSLSKTPTVFHATRDGYRADFPDGPSEVLISAITDLALVEEASLDWEQVLEFRKDSDARMKYRRFVRWITSELMARTPAQVQDVLSSRLEDYEWALRKHGLKTVLGALDATLDPKFLTAMSTTAVAAGLASSSPTPGDVDWNDPYPRPRGCQVWSGSH